MKTPLGKVQIEQFSISNFRSIKNLELRGLSDKVIFHGENNSGKSSICLALQFLFSRKIPFEMEVDEGIESSSKGPFWRGVLKGFADNFRNFVESEISFSIRISSESLPPVLIDKQIVKEIKGCHKYQHKFQGSIVRINDSQDAEMILDSYELGDIIVMKSDRTDAPEFFPEINNSGVELKKPEMMEIGEKLLSYFDDLVTVVPADRYLISNEKKHAVEHITSKNFKSWFLSKYLDRDGYFIFETVQDWFSKDPFKYGYLGFEENGDEVDLLVAEKGKPRVPVSMVGSGTQQVLVSLGFIASARGSIICFEEPELNLSPKTQRKFIQMLCDLIENNGLVSQLIITSHSEVIGALGHLQRFGVSLNSEGTKVVTWSENVNRSIFGNGSPSQ